MEILLLKHLTGKLVQVHLIILHNAVPDIGFKQSGSSDFDSEAMRKPEKVGKSESQEEVSSGLPDFRASGLFTTYFCKLLFPI